MDVELHIEVGGNVAPLRARLQRALTTIGADPGADIPVPGVAARWAVVQRQGQVPEVVVRLLGQGTSSRLELGQSVVLEGVTLRLESAAAAPARKRFSVQPLVDRLGAVDDPEQALAELLEALMAVTDADSGAVVLREADSYRLAVDRTRASGDTRALLSDHIVREVLEKGHSVLAGDLSAEPRFASIPSVVMLRLRAVLCVPMQLQGHVLGALFLGRRGGAQTMDERLVEQVQLLASMSVPLLIQLRRPRADGTDAARTGIADLLIGDCAAMYSVRALVDRVAPSDLSVLVRGPTGTGKELVARAVHEASSRANKPLVALNCAAVPESLLEAELFGYRRGAFTGALADRVGRIEEADGSTLFLDELGDMPGPMQAALLRVLETREVTRLGENRSRRVDFRLVAATHRDLEADVRSGRFRQDLLYRLQELVITLPPLSARGGDILLLAQLFLRQTEHQLGLGGRRLSTDAAECLMRHRWPGNVRELRAAMRRAAILCDGREILAEHLGLQPDVGHPPSPSAPAAVAELDLDRPLVEARDAFVSRYVAAMLERCGGDRVQAAERLGISLRSLYRYLA